ncbi:MAG: hypothetical protein HYZ48_00755 [Chlamydiales bacterium]|nr:hypothetical protein [Chlamydiales bacterium]
MKNPVKSIRFASLACVTALTILMQGLQAAGAPTPEEIIAAVEQISQADGSAGLTDLHEQLILWLKENPFPSAQAPYSDWNAYAKRCQGELGTDRSASENSASSKITTDINGYIQKNHLDGGSVWSLVNEMKPSPSDIIDAAFTSYANLIQSSLVNPIWSGKPGTLPSPPHPVDPDMQQATEQTLKIQGVSYVLFPDPQAPGDLSKAMGFPISHTSDAGGAAVLSATSTEAIWYTLENAYDAQDRYLFWQTLNGYLYLTEQKAAAVEGTSWASTPGLAGWIIDLGQPPGSVFQGGGFPYPQKNPGDPSLSTAMDADLQIIQFMLKGLTQFGDLQLHCFGSFPNGAVPADREMSYLIDQAVMTYLYNDISGHPQSSYDLAHHGFKYQNTTYNPVLCNDNWGGGGWKEDGLQSDQGTFLNPSYFDPMALSYIYTYAIQSKNPAISSQTAAFKQAVLNSMAYLSVLQSRYADPADPHSAGMPDNPAWNENDGPDGKGPHPVGWDSIRFLTNVGKFVAACEGKQMQDPFGILEPLKAMGQKMLNYVICHSENPYSETMILGNTPQGAQLKGGALLGPLLVAMKALTPGDPHIPAVSDSLEKVLMIDKNRMDPADSSAYLYWQDQYYGTELGLVNKADAAK